MEKENDILTEEGSEDSAQSENSESLQEQDIPVYTERRCVNCQALLKDEQMFCHECGAPQSKICSKCGAEIHEGQCFCSSCGQKITDSNSTISNMNDANNQFDNSINHMQKHIKTVSTIILFVLFACIVIGCVLAKKESEKRAIEEYINDGKSFMSLSVEAGANLEDISDTVQTYWYENIWQHKHGYDINDAIEYALKDKSDEINDAKVHKSKMESLYLHLKTVPDNIDKTKKSEIEEICSAVKELYNIYTDFYSLATNPTGNYNSYRDNNSEITDEFLSKYRALENLLK